MRRALVTIILALSITGCAWLEKEGLYATPQTPQQAVYQAEGQFLATKTLAATYWSLPPCEGVGAPIVCAKADVVKMLQSSSYSAEQVLAAAERTVTNPGFKWDRKSVFPDIVIGAQNAVTAFRNVVNSTGVQTPAGGGT